MNTCDADELRHQLLQEFYRLAEKPEEWETSIEFFVGPTYTRGTLCLSKDRLFAYDGHVYKLSANGRDIHCEKTTMPATMIETTEYTRGWLKRAREEKVEKTIFAPNDSQFVTTCQSLIKNIHQHQECKALEEALANVNKPKAKTPRKAKASKEGKEGVKG